MRIDAKYLESKETHLGASVIHWSAEVHEELIIRDLAVLLNVECIKHNLDLGWCPSKSVLGNALCELLDIKGFTVVVVHDAELAGDTTDPTGTM